MRRLFLFTTALLPTIAAIVIGSFVARKVAAQAGRWIGNGVPATPQFRRPRP